MSDRSNLERASWIAGILSAAIAVFLLLKPDGLKASVEDQKQQFQAPSSSIASSPIAASVRSPSISPLASGCTKETGNLSSALESVQSIYATTKRDAMYLNIARRALCIGDQEVYEDSTAKIYTTTTRDQAYSEGVDHYLQVRNSDMALDFAKKIYQTTVRDEALARIASRIASQ